jgi:hypothetical protein
MRGYTTFTNPGPGKFYRARPYATGTTRLDLIVVFMGDDEYVSESALPGPMAAAATAEELAPSLCSDRTCTFPAQGRSINLIAMKRR